MSPRECAWAHVQTRGLHQMFEYSPPYVSETEPLTEPRGYWLTKLASNQALGCLLSLPPQSWQYKCAQLCIFPWIAMALLNCQLDNIWNEMQS